MMAPFKIGVLDQSPVRSGGTEQDAVAETIQLAQACEEWGYHRYWLAEHHGTDGFAGSAPEIMIPRVADATSRIRVGSGGVMLSHYSPLKVAETFRLLEVMFPGRIDLGIGRAPGSDQLTAAALAYGSQIGIEYFPTKIADMIAFLTDQIPPTEVFARVRATPRSSTAPDVWLLGSSGGSATYAAQFGLPLSFAHFIAPGGGADVIRAYRAAFKPSELYPEPRVNLCVFVICAERKEEALRLAKSRDLWRIRLEQGELGPYPSIEEAEAYEYSEAEQAGIERTRGRTVIGTPDQVRPALETLIETHGADELIVLTITHNFAARLRSYELIAEAFGLDG
jgi:luciferase family oxidoreductase group 1